MHEIMFKPGMLRSVIIHRDDPAHGVHSRWHDAQSKSPNSQARPNSASAGTGMMRVVSRRLFFPVGAQRTCTLAHRPRAGDVIISICAVI